MTVSSAPGKVYLFGEHAVVYGEPAVPCAIERRATVSSTEIDEGLRFTRTTCNWTALLSSIPVTGRAHTDVDVAESLVEAGMGYVNEAVAQARDAANAPKRALMLLSRATSRLVQASGRRQPSSSPVSTPRRANSGRTVSERIADRAYQVEHAVQDGQASRADTFCSAMGGAVRVEGDDCRRLEGIDTLPFVIGYDGGAGDTGALVAGVRDLRGKYDFAADTVAAIGDIVREGESVRERRLRTARGADGFSRGLLSALGVSSRSHDSRCARSATPTPRRETHRGRRRRLYRRTGRNGRRAHRAEVHAGV